MSRHETEPGIRATHSVTFLPWEIKAIREVASAAGVSVTRWLHDVAVTASEQAPELEPPSITVNVHMDGNGADKRQLEHLIASQLGRIAAQHGIRGY